MNKIVFANPNAGNALASKLRASQLNIVTDINQYDALIDSIKAPIHVIAAGGDGTSHLVINKLVQANKLKFVKYSMLPMGTGNDLARSIGFTDSDIDWITHGDYTEKRLPLWKMTRTVNDISQQQVFINFIGIGIDAQMVGRAEKWRSWRNRIYTQFIYVIAALRYLVYRLPKNISIKLDKDPIHCRAGIILANIHSYAGGCKLGDGANNHNTQLNVFKLQSWFSLVRIILTRLFKNNIRRPDAITFTAQIVGAKLPIQMDGEFLEPTDQIATIRVEPLDQELCFWVPVHHKTG